MKLSDIRDLPPTIDADVMAELLGCSRWTVYDLARRGELPVAPLKMGRRLRWPTLKVLDALGLAHDNAVNESSSMKDGA